MLEEDIVLGKKLKDIYHYNFILMQHGSKQFNVTPQYSTRTKYVTIDTDVLCRLSNLN